MNSALKKIMYRKRMAQNKFWKDKGNRQKWEEYKKARNEFVKVNRLSRCNYFKKHCKDGTNSKSFWSVVKPYITNKCNNENNIMLKEGNDIVTDSSDIAKIFNDYFIACIDEGIYSVRIIHGKGRGILKDRVRKLLEKNPLVSSFTNAPLEAGGWGATLVELKHGQ